MLVHVCKMGKIDDRVKLQIASLRKKGYNIRTITNHLNSKGLSVSRYNIRYWLKAYDSGQITERWVDIKPKQRSSKKVSERDAEWIRQLLKTDPSMSSRQVHRALISNGVVSFSLSTTKKTIDAAGFTHSKPRYGLMVRKANRP